MNPTKYPKERHMMMASDESKLRDEFAKLVFPAVFKDSKSGATFSAIASDTYYMADCLIAARYGEVKQ